MPLYRPLLPLLALLLLASLVSIPAAVAEPDDLPRTAGSFSSAKKWLYEEVYNDRRTSFYCGCAFDERRRVDLQSCGLEGLRDQPRARRIEAEHVFPAAQFGQQRRCWREPERYPACIKSSGKTVSGRTCCERVDPVFEAAHNDLMNLFPAVGEVNGDRRDYRWGMIPGQKRDYGRCRIEIDASLRRAEPPEGVRGDIARTMFYMERTYGFALSDQQRQLYRAWDRQDPPDDWERERNRRIRLIQGRGNEFVENWEQTHPQVATRAACGEKTTCGEMASCEEARFHLESCGLSRLDRDRDGIPCEALCR